MFKKIAGDGFGNGVHCVAIAMAANVPTALAPVHATITSDAKMSGSAAEHLSAAFEVWFLDAACRPGHVGKASRPKHLTHREAGRG